ncbi:MAG: hypothetical protein KAS95_08960 [Candidatus Heimdallarchaeota archaeon]|nr:hypothetical protein [Candidatus Heimdallarchaeota archaeon]
MSSSLINRLREYASSMKDWDKIKTSVEGVSLVKMPSGEKLSLEIIPVNEEGKPLKRKGLFVTSIEQFEAFKDIFINEKAHDLIQGIDALIEKKVVVKDSSEEEDVFEL